MKTKRNIENERLTVRINDETKQEMVEFADKYDVSLAWIVKRSWATFKESVKKGQIKL